MIALEKKILQLIKERQPLDYPGGKVLAFFRGRKIVDVSYGKTWAYYDLASLTKVLFTSSVLMTLVEQKTISLADTVQRFLPWYPNGKVRLSHLLNHTAGHVDWRPFYKKIDLETSVPDRWPQMFAQIRNLPGLVGRGLAGVPAVYSDVDFFLLGGVLEAVLEMPLLRIWQQHQSRYFPRSGFHFAPRSRATFSKDDYAPTEPCVWRQRLLQGEVHDENAFALGEVAPHAGLFGTIDDLGVWMRALRKIERQNVGFVSQKTLQFFTEPSLPARRGAWGFGFMKPSAQSTAGRHFHRKMAYGHTGFTGTSVWMDPSKDLQVALVSNRVYPTRKNRDFIVLRPRIHDCIVESLSARRLL